MHKNAQKKKLCFNGYHCFFYHKTSNDIYWEILSNKIQWRIYISSVSHLYIQRLPSIHPTSPIYTSNTFHLYIQYSEIREFSNTKVSNEIAFIKHEESHDYNIGWKLKAKNLSFRRYFQPESRWIGQLTEAERTVRCKITFLAEVGLLPLLPYNILFLCESCGYLKRQ